MKKHREMHDSGDGRLFECAVYYRDDDGDSGYGDNAQVAFWYGDYSKSPSKPNPKWWRSIDPDNRPDSFDLACERRFD